MSIMYFDICAAVVMLVLMFSVATRKMTAGTVNKLFIFMTAVTFAANIFDLLAVYNDTVNTALNHASLSFMYFVHTGYMLFHNLTVSAYLLFVIGLSDIWHQLKGKKLAIAALIAPIVSVAAVLVINLFTGIIFHFDDNYKYIRGDFMLLLYLCAFSNIVVCAFYLIRYRKIFTKAKFFALLSLIPLEMTAVGVQFFNPSLLVEMFSNAVALFLIATVVQRPEEFMDNVTTLKNYNAYANETKQNFYNKKPVTLILVNISNFASLSRILSYDNANVLLKKAAGDMMNVNRELRLHAELYHIQGGRYRCIISGVSREKAEEAAEKINSLLKQTVYISSLKLNLTAYVCIIKCPEDIADYKTLISFGNELQDKTPYTGQVLRASEVAAKNAFELSNVLDEIIDSAIAQKRFMVYYQPIYSAEQKRFVSAEALLRLKDEKYGFISPELFITAAEKSGAIHRIGDFVMEEVCRFISSERYKKLGLDYIEVNLSVSQCMSPDLADKILGIMSRYNVSPDQINLEITETAANYAQDIMTENIEKLYRAGLTFSLDDYGTGYSNLSRVISLPLEIIKLDKSITDIKDNHKMWIVVQNTIKMIKDMKMRIVVEGIETHELLEKFTELKCDYIQGFYFSKPIPEDQFVDFIENRE